MSDLRPRQTGYPCVPPIHGRRVIQVAPAARGQPVLMPQLPPRPPGGATVLMNRRTPGSKMKQHINKNMKLTHPSVSDRLAWAPTPRCFPLFGGSRRGGGPRAVVRAQRGPDLGDLGRLWEGGQRAVG